MTGVGGSTAGRRGLHAAETVRRRRHAAPTLGRDRDFLRFWFGEGVSQVGSQITTLALPLTAIITLQASSAQVGLLNAASYAPFLVVTLLVGVWVDRVRRRPLMLLANLGRLVLIGSVPALAVLDLLRVEYLYVTALLVGVLTVVFDVAHQSYLPSLVGRSHLVEGNSKLQATNSLAQMGGPGLAGLLVQVATAPIALVVDAASYGVSVLTLLMVRRREPRPPTPDEPEPLRRALADGVRVVFGNAILRACALQSGLYNLCFIALQTVYVLYTARDLGMSPGAIGLTLSTGAVGSLLGSFAANPLKRALGLGPAILLAVVLGCATAFLVPLAPDARLVAAAMFVVAFGAAGAGATIANIHIISLRQAITPEVLLGRMNAGYRLVSWGTLPLGALLGGWLGGLIGLRPTLFLIAAGFVAPVVVLALSPVRSLRDIPLEPMAVR